MSYEKLGFVSGQKLKAEHLNHMEEGIANVSWDDLKNKPFYSELVEGAATFDGDLTGKEYYDMGGEGILIKMSDTPLSIEELIGSTVIIKHNISELGATDGDAIIEFTITEDFIQKQEVDESRYILVVISELEIPVAYIIKGDLSDMGAPLTEGVFYMYMNMGEEYLYTNSISCLKGIQEHITTIEDKYIPDTIVRKDNPTAAIINVAELPINNIKKNMIYQLINKAYYVEINYEGGWRVLSDYDVRCVDSLPETGVPYINEVDNQHVLYYNTSENRVYIFENDAWTTGIVQKDKIIHIADLHKSWHGDLYSGHYVVLDSTLYTYNNGWVPIFSGVKQGNGLNSMVFNDAMNVASGDYSHVEGTGYFASPCCKVLSKIANNVYIFNSLDGLRVGCYITHSVEPITAKIVSIDESSNQVTLDCDVSLKSGDYVLSRYGIASGFASHAEGYNTHAEGHSSHTEGYNTYAKGDFSHAEGRETYAEGDWSHAEGCMTHAEGYYSHAEGVKTHAKGHRSHAEGDETYAEGNCSHAEGEETHAISYAQHVQGMYNLVDTEHDINDTWNRGKYAHIVGNGTSAKRSNAHTLDWDGNAWYAGTVEGTAMIIKSPNGTRFQITVDDNGNLTATAIVEETE